MKIRTATMEDRENIFNEFCKKSKYVYDFTNKISYSNEEVFRKGWVLVAEEAGKLLGFISFRHKVRSPESTLYFLMTSEEARGKGIAKALMEAMMESSQHTKMRLNVMKNNNALGFYLKQGFDIVETPPHGKWSILEKEFAK